MTNDKPATDEIQRLGQEWEAGGQYLIRKNGYYYRPNASGYTASIAEAGRYTLDEAIRHSHPNGPDGPRDGITYEPAPPLATDEAAEVTLRLMDISFLNAHALTCEEEGLPKVAAAFRGIAQRIEASLARRRARASDGREDETIMVPREPTDDKLRGNVADIARRIGIQATCLEHYAEQSGFTGKPVPSTFHSQAGHFRDLAAELRAALGDTA